MVLTVAYRFPTVLPIFSGHGPLSEPSCPMEKNKLMAACTNSLFSALFLLFVITCICANLETSIRHTCLQPYLSICAPSKKEYFHHYFSTLFAVSNFSIKHLLIQ